MDKQQRTLESVLGLVVPVGIGVACGMAFLHRAAYALFPEPPDPLEFMAYYSLLGATNVLAATAAVTAVGSLMLRPYLPLSIRARMVLVAGAFVGAFLAGGNLGMGLAFGFVTAVSAVCAEAADRIGRWLAELPSGGEPDDWEPVAFDT